MIMPKVIIVDRNTIVCKLFVFIATQGYTCFEQIHEAATNKTATLWSLASHLTNHQSKVIAQSAGAVE